MAGAGKKTFTAGETLTASDVNTYLMEQSVMVFGGTAARASAIPTPSEGMTTYRTDTQQIESYDGAEWRGMSGLQLVKKQTIGSAVSNVVVTNAFSADYENYQIVVTGGVNTGAGTFVGIQLGSTATGYYNSRLGLTWASTTYQAQALTNHSSFIFAGAGTANNFNMNTTVLQPFAAKQTTFTSFAVDPSTAGQFWNSACYLDNTTSYTGFNIFPNGGTLTGGTIYVYGYGT